MRGLAHDLRNAWRQLSRAPSSAVGVVVTLALGIGAATAVYALFNHVLFRPVPGVASGSELITVSFQRPDRSAITSGPLVAIPALRTAGAEVGVEYLGHGRGSSKMAVVVPIGTQATLEGVDFVSSQYFDALGVRPSAGRLLTDAEADSDSANPVVISERLWRARLGGTGEALGRPLTVNGHSFVVVGVVARFRGWTNWTRVGETDLWLPAGSQRRVTGQAWMSEPVGRIRPGAPLDVIEARLQAAYASLAGTLSARAGEYTPFVYAGLFPAYRDAALPTSLYWLLMGAAALLLGLACSNAANLLLVQSWRRQQDIAVRLAVGASRWRIVRQSVAESLMLAALAGTLGLLVARLLMTLFSGMRLLEYFPDFVDIEIDGRVIAFGLVAALVTVLAAGTVPGMLASRTDVRRVLVSGGRTLTRRHTLRAGLVVAQVALSLILVAGAVVLNRSAQQLLATDVGVNLDQVVELEIRPDNLGYDTTRSAAIVAATVDGLRRSGFEDVAVSYPHPLTAITSPILMKTPAMAEPQRKRVVEASVSPNYFDVLQIPLIRGRTFVLSEYREPDSIDPMPVILNSTLARDLFDSEPAVGRTFSFQRNVGPERLSGTALVIGEVGDTRPAAIRAGLLPVLYHARTPGFRYASIVMRPIDRAERVEERVRAVVGQVDQGLPITTLRPLRDRVAEELSEDRVQARLSGILALLAVWFAATGVLSAISQFVTERRRDFGIRMALGASGPIVVRHVLRGVMALSVLGVALGLGGYWGTSRWLEARLFELEPLDPAALGVAVTLILLITAGAAFVPARRATRVDPISVLRQE